jgi:hypothetical protein
MKTAEVGELAKEILGAQWAPVEIERVDVATHDDQLGEEAFYLKVFLARPDLPLPVGAFISGQSRLRDELLQRGESRFPYVEAVNPRGKMGEVALRALSRP